MLSGNYSVPRIEALDGILPKESATFTFSCPPELVLIGPNSTTCRGNGEWEPDPSGLTYAGITKLTPNFTIVTKDMKINNMQLYVSIHFSTSPWNLP